MLPENKNTVIYRADVSAARWPVPSPERGPRSFSLGAPGSLLVAAAADVAVTAVCAVGEDS